MKRLILAALLSISTYAFAETDFSKYMHLVTPIEGVVLSQESIEFMKVAGDVRGYYRKDGTYVESYHRSAPNSTKLDNYTTEGNYNPYTLEDGNRSPYTPEPEPTLSRPRRGWK